MRPLANLPLALVALSALAACSLTPTKDRKQEQQATPVPHAQAGPVPTYQMRPPIDPSVDRLAPDGNGAAIYAQRCGYCHLPWGMGANLLTKQQVALGRPPAMGLLTNRADLTADYVKQVVREGKGAMPPQTRVDITDPELDAVADFLAKTPDEAAAPSPSPTPAATETAK